MTTMASANDEKYHVQIRSDDKAPINLREIFQNRELLLTLAERDIKVRYKQTALGVVWVVLQPLMASLIFAFIFGVLARMPSDGQPYLLFAFAGLMAWNTFAQTITRASISLTSNSQMISKVYFPRLILPLSSAGSCLVDFVVTLVMMFVLLAIYRVWPGSAVLLLPVWLLILMVMAMGIGLLAGALMVKYRDINHIIPTFLQLGLFISPVAWSGLLIPEKLRWIFMLNPLNGLLEAFRWSLLGDSALSVGSVVYSTVVAVLIFWLGAMVFKQQERDFADVI
jgi:lipopolysaccharide transport system permease protein